MKVRLCVGGAKIPAVVAWSREYLAELTGNPLGDERVAVCEVDVAEILKKENEELKKQLSQLHTRDRIREVLEGDITNLSGSKIEKKDGSGKKR